MEPSAHCLATRFGCRRLRLTNSQVNARPLMAPLLLLAVTLLLLAPAYAGSLSGTFDGTATLTPTGTPGVFIQNFTGDGTDNTYGAFDVTSMSTIDFSSPPHISLTNGMITETFLNGTLLATGSGSGTANGLGMATFTINFVITGGTGVFLGAHGEGTITGDITQTSPTTEAISNASYMGRVTLPTPEPSSLGLLVLGATMGYKFLSKYRG